MCFVTVRPSSTLFSGPITIMAAQTPLQGVDQVPTKSGARCSSSAASLQADTYLLLFRGMRSTRSKITKGKEEVSPNFYFQSVTKND